MEKSFRSDINEPVNGDHIPGDGGQRLYVWHLIPETQPIAMVCLVHGLGEHSQRYLEMAGFMTQRGIVVVGYDQRGHGLTYGSRGGVRSARVFHNDLEYLLMYARSLYPDLPLFLFGHSMGGNLVANYLIQDASREITGAIISSAWFELSRKVPSYMRFIGKVTGTLLPFVRLGNGIEPNLLSADQESVEAYINDPLVHDRITALLFFDLNRAGMYALENGSRIKVPLLVTHGSDDHITSHEASRRFAAKAGKEGSFHSWGGLRHEPHKEVIRNEVFKKYTEWILSLADPSSGSD